MNELIPMALFALVMSITPGPVNMVTLNSGLNHGFRRTFAYVSGATIGFTLLLLGLGMGLSSVVMAYPQYLQVLSVLGTLYMIYMGYKILSSRPSDGKSSETKIPKFMEGALLQCSSSKAWIACLSGISAFAKADSIIPLLTFIGIYFLVCYLCISLWALAGEQLQMWLVNDKYKMWFSRVMGSLLIGTGLMLGYQILTM